MNTSSIDSGSNLKLSGRIIAPGIAFGYAHFEEPVSAVLSTSIKLESVDNELNRQPRHENQQRSI